MYIRERQGKILFIYIFDTRGICIALQKTELIKYY